MRKLQAIYFRKISEALARLGARNVSNCKWYSFSGSRHFGDVREHKSVFPLADGLTEDGVWREEDSFVVVVLPEKIVDQDTISDEKNCIR